MLEHTRPRMRYLLGVSAVWLSLWLIPVAVLLASFGTQNVFSQIAVFFSKMAMVTFGGAYAVLAYVAQQAVQHYGWLKPGEMLDGLGMAETTPGPLIMVSAVRGLHGGVPTLWASFSAAGRDARGTARDLGDVYPVLSLDFPRCTLRGEA